uniref:Uncharacterized protein n=1 Tax=Medicago truncatula TaxID=3880 RepID=Q2HTN5_MEDTR|nr:hypothetical protein MtrDRAFT_AC150244g42v2 [Medicago truncatula]
MTASLSAVLLLFRGFWGCLSVASCCAVRLGKISCF